MRTMRGTLLAALAATLFLTAAAQEPRAPLPGGAQGAKARQRSQPRLSPQQVLAASRPGAAAAAPTRGPVVSRSVRHDVSPPLVSIEPVQPSPQEIREIPLRPLPKAERAEALPSAQSLDPAVQNFAPVTPTIPAPLETFEGISSQDNLSVLGFQVFPPDTNGDIGPNHYVQIVNLLLAIYDRNGTRLFGPVGTNTLWSGFGGPCESHNDGDPIALYDPLADRWLISQFALFASDGFHQCIAISQTGDPLGAWFRYDFLISADKLNDYPHFGVWPDAYYMSINQFFGFDGFAGAGAVAFERDRMLQGLSARMVYFDLFDVNPNFSGMLPSDLDGLRPPPPGAPNYFAEVDDSTFGFPSDRLQVFQFRVDWTNTANSTFTGPQVIDLTAAGKSFDPTPGDIPQPGTTVGLDSLSDRLMYRLAYRNFGDHESLVVNHTVDADGTNHAGIRWYEIRNPGGSPPTLFQAGTFAPNSRHRWMASAAMDAAGDIAVGYSISSTGLFPSIRYTGRLVGDPAGTLPQGEATLIAGTGSQGVFRWGDYSMMAVDPADDCTFWYTTEYYALADLSFNWQTRVGSFKFPSCTAPQTGTVQGTVRDADTNLPLPNATVKVGDFSRVTDSNGLYQVGPLLPGTYTVTASAFGYFPQTVNNLVVSAGGTTAQDFSLVPRPIVSVDGTVTDGSGHGWPLYARIDITDISQGRALSGSPVFTNPVTGGYSLLVPQEEEFGFTVSSVRPGYRSAARTVAAPLGGATENFSLLANFEACAAPGYQARLGRITGTQSVYFQDFEANDGGFTVSGPTSWQWGTPSSGPGSAHSGTKSWATNLAGNYNDNENGTITSPNIDLSAFTGQTLLLTWFQWLQTEQFFDFASVEVSHDGGATWRRVYGVVSGSVDLSWTQRRVVLDPSDAVSNFRVRFHLTSDFSVTFPGFYVDDVDISVAQVTLVQPLLAERFESGATPPGWTVVDNAGTGQVWRFDNPGGRDNFTVGFDGAGGRFAIVDSEFYGPGGSQDTTLVSPALDLSGLTNVQIEFDDDFPTHSLNDVGDVDVSTDGGLTWTNVFRRVGDNVCDDFDGCFEAIIPAHRVVDISSLAAGHPDVKVRFHYYNAASEVWWQVDNVRVEEPGDVTLCQPLTGGLVVGNVYDANTNLPLNASTVTSDNESADGTRAFATPNDPAVDDALYILFSSLTGPQPFTASFTTFGKSYVPQTQPVTVVADSVVTQNFALELAPNPVPTAGSLFPATALAGSGAFPLNVSGSDFVPGSVVRWNGSDRPTAFVSSTQLEADIPASDLADPGTASVTVFNPAPGGGTSAPLTFTILPNPVPTAGSLLPAEAPAGLGAFTLTVNGLDFVAGSVVRWNGSDRPTGFVSSTQLRADIPASDLANLGTASVTVFNPAPGGGTSNVLTFTILPNPVPTVVSLSPAEALAGNGAFPLNVSGSGFLAGSVVRWNGSDRPTVFAASFQLRANIPASDIANVGTASVTVFTPAPGGGTSAPLTFTILPNPDAAFRGRVRDVNLVGIEGATVSAFQSGVLKFQTTTNSNGGYILNVTAGTYDLVASKAGFISVTKLALAISSSQTLTGIKFKLFRESFFQGTVTSASGGGPLADATVEALKNGVVKFSTTTAPDGTYSLLVRKGTYTLRASAPSFNPRSKTDQTIGDGVTKTGMDFALQPQ